MSVNIDIPVYRSVKEAPESYKSAKYFTENGLQHNGVAVAKISRGCFNYDLFDLNTATKIVEDTECKTKVENTNSNATVVEDVKEDNNKTSDTVLVKVKKSEVLPVYLSEEEVPDNLVTIMALKDKGYRHNNIVKGILQIDKSFHYLFDINDVINVDEAPTGAKVYKSLNEAKKYETNVKGISYFHERGLMHNGIVVAVYKVGKKYNELYDCTDVFVVDEEKHNLFLEAEKEKYKEDVAQLRRDIKNALPSYTKDNVPAHLKTKSEIESEGYTPRGSVVAKLLSGKGNTYYSLYDSQNVLLQPTKYWSIQENRFKNTPDKYVIVSFESTGLSDKDEISQLTVLDLSGNILFNSYFKTKRKSNLSVDAPTWESKWNELYNIIGNKIIISYNAQSCIRLIHQTCIRYKTFLKQELKSLCAMKYANHICRYLESCSSLIKVTDYLGLKINERELENRKNDSEFNAYNCLYLINKDAEIFTARNRAQEYFIALCKKDDKGVGKRQRYMEGSAWLQKNYGIQYQDIQFTSLEIANSIISKLERFA